MSDSPHLIIKGEPREPEIAIVAHRMGQFVPMTPKKFGIFTSHEEAMETARVYVKLHPEFAAKWAGWHLASIRVDNQVSIGGQG